MLSALSLALLCAVGAGVGPVAQAAAPLQIDCVQDESAERLQNFTFKDVQEKDTIPLSRFKGYVALVVNVATY
uniref:Putative selenium dependent salivary glutathione peroxidase n=1 Tax=Ixodes scapularis TaxID=6945 RepID=A0A4D5SAU3_IXOSC